MANRSISFLPVGSCILLDLPDSKVDCSVYNANRCVGCKFLARFITGETVDDFGSSGHVICVVLWLVTLLVGICGTVGNVFIIHVLSRQMRNTAFDTFLVALAWIDMACSVTCMIGTTATIVFYENLNRGIVTLYLFQWGGSSALFFKSASSFLTVVITVERYLAVAFPLKASNYVTKRRTRMLVAGVILFSFMMALPRFTSSTIRENVVGRDIMSTHNLEYLILSTPLQRFWYGTMRGYFNQIDFWLPLPLLLLFNGLVYLHVLEFASRRQEMKMGQRKEIRAVKMFLPVVVVLFLCNIIPIIHYAFIHNGVMYREIHLANFASFAFNSAANLPIYYHKGPEFKKESRAVLTKLFPLLGKRLPGHEESTASATRSTGETEMQPIGNQSI